MLIPRWLCALCCLVSVCALCSACGPCQEFGEGAGLVKVPIPADKTDFIGDWSCEDSKTYIAIAANGEASARLPLSSKGTGQKTITGGAVRFEGDDLIVHLFGIEQRWTVDEPPNDHSMTLSGLVCHRIR